MPKVKLPYGKKSITIDIPEDRLEGILVSKVNKYSTQESEEDIVKKAIINPIGVPRLKDLARDKKKIVVISSDHTRPVPSHITMPIILDEIRKGNPEANITILVATGFHRASTKVELREKYGKEIVNREKIVIHNSRDKDSMLKIGILPSGGDFILNKLAIEADLLVAEGFIEPHFFAGFSGGRKSILPGIASKETVLANHCSEFIAHPKARTGVLKGNPIHEDMLYAAKKANLNFILNVVINGDKKIINAFAGHWEEAHLKGCKFVSKLAGVKPKLADIVITTNGGYPLDQNIYQSVKGMTAAEATCKKGGVIIIASTCADGHGGDSFYNTFAKANSVQNVIDEIMVRNRNKTIPDQWESQILARILLKCKVIMVTNASKKMVENMHMKWAASIEGAIEMADEMLGNRGKITIISDGVSVIVR
jgi:nickel-dependent lactate racemase